jgi:hypothetical protein
VNFYHLLFYRLLGRMDRKREISRVLDRLLSSERIKESLRVQIQNTRFYCNGLMECPITVFPFVRRQHAQFSWKQALASSCLQIVHIHTCVAVVVSELIFFCCFDLASTYNHSATSGTPIMKKTIMVRIGILSTNNEIPKHKVPIPSIESQRVVVSILSPVVYIDVLFLNNFST